MYLMVVGINDDRHLASLTSPRRRRTRRTRSTSSTRGTSPARVRHWHRWHRVGFRSSPAVNARRLGRVFATRTRPSSSAPIGGRSGGRPSIVTAWSTRCVSTASSPRTCSSCRARWRSKDGRNSSPSTHPARRPTAVRWSGCNTPSPSSGRPASRHSRSSTSTTSTPRSRASTSSAPPKPPTPATRAPRTRRLGREAGSWSCSTKVDSMKPRPCWPTISYASIAGASYPCRHRTDAMPSSSRHAPPPTPASPTSPT